jgi:hypothetical protein
MLVNWDPSSVMILFVTPNLQMIFLDKLDCKLLVDLDYRVASGHFVNLSMTTYRYQNPPTALPRMSSPHTMTSHP